MWATRAFYSAAVLAIALPVMAQNGITQFVGVLDNLMVGRIRHQAQMGGVVAIANQLIFVFNLCIFGGLSGAGIFGAQFAGKRDNDGIRYVFRFKLIVCIIVCCLSVALLSFLDAPLINLFLHEGSEEGDLALTLASGRTYISVMLFGLVPYALSQCYASSLRETGETVVPMIGSGAAVLVNLVFNWLLIFGKLGFPKLGVEGAAIATVLSRFVELAIMMLWAHTHAARFPFFKGVYSVFLFAETTCKRA